MISLSVILITYNEEHNLHRCLTSVKSVADEIVVVDSNSTDKTVQIAMGFGARVVQRDFDGYAQQKNYATGLAANDWILSMDADEELTPELIASIAEVKTQPSCNVYRMARLTNYCGKWIRHCGWYPDWQLRFFNRKKANWSDATIHERVEAERKLRIPKDILHFPFENIFSQIHTNNRYSNLQAEELKTKGKSFSRFKLITKPFSKFIETYIWKRGFLDGLPGFIISVGASYSVFLKWAKLWELGHKDTWDQQNKEMINSISK